MGRLVRTGDQVAGDFLGVNPLSNLQAAAQARRQLPPATPQPGL